MQLIETLILEREDLFNNKINTDISILELKDFLITSNLLLKYAIVLFIDKDGQYRFLKNRFGNI
jgi:hypothetical protein